MPSVWAIDDTAADILACSHQVLSCGLFDRDGKCFGTPDLQTAGKMVFGFSKGDAHL